MLSRRLRTATSYLMTILAILTPATSALATPDTLDRDKIDSEFKWDLSDIYDNWDSREDDMVKMEGLMADYTSLQGTLNQGPKQILKANRMGDELGQLASKLYRFAALQSVTNTADNEISARVQQGVPITADVLTQIYTELWEGQHGEAATFDEYYGSTWTRIPHFYNSPFYVYQYATCYASSAQIYQTITSGSANDRQTAVHRYLNLLKSGGNDHPMKQLKKAGVDLSKADAFEAVIKNLDGLVTQLEEVLEDLEG